jgi:hypothetical protein
VAAIVLAEPGHTGATYELAGPEALSQVEVTSLLSENVRRPVHARVVSLAAWEQSARAAGLGDYQVRTLVEMFRYYERYGFSGNPRVLGWLLQRRPTTFGAFLERVARER